jgi:signal peptidase II
LLSLRSRLFLVYFASTFVADCFIKLYVSQALLKPLPLWPNVLQLNWVENRGVAFSLLSHWPLPYKLFLILGLLLCLALWGFKQRQHLGIVGTCGLALSLAGGLNNWLDRALDGSVTDYIDIVLIHFPVFNLSDIAVVLGCTGLALHFWNNPLPPTKA